jgi:uncharacterized protein YfdQ (DUF2303 family)
MPAYPNPDLIGDVQAAIAAGAALGDPRTVVAPAEGDPAGVFTVVPNNYKVESLEAFLPRPTRVRGTAALDDAESFIAYVNAFKQAATRLFFDTAHESFAALFDYHQPAEGGAVMPSWCDHTASFSPARSEEFKAWLDHNKKQMSQVEFARFIEENLPDIVEPAGAELLEVALTMEAKKEVTFSSGVRLANGQVQFQYDEEIRGTAKKGTLEIPEQFTLGIPIHLGGPAYRIPVRLRWRLHDGKAMFWYEIARPSRFIEDALKEIRERVAGETGLAVLAGSVSLA